jgi:hypothetical protein
MVHPLNLPFDPVVNTPLGDSKFSQNHPCDISSREITVIDDDRHPQTLERFAALFVGHHRKAHEIGKVGSSNMGRLAQDIDFRSRNHAEFPVVHADRLPEPRIVGIAERGVVAVGDGLLQTKMIAFNGMVVNSELDERVGQCATDSAHADDQDRCGDGSWNKLYVGFPQSTPAHPSSQRSPGLREIRSDSHAEGDRRDQHGRARFSDDSANFR